MAKIERKQDQSIAKYFCIVKQSLDKMEERILHKLKSTSWIESVQNYYTAGVAQWPALSLLFVNSSNEASILHVVKQMRFDFDKYIFYWYSSIFSRQGRTHQ